MDSPQVLRQSARRSCDIARSTLLFVGLILPGLPAQTTLGDPLAAELRPLLQAQDPVVRGEAALILAASKEEQLRPVLASMVQDQAPEAARHRALVALGLLGGTGAEAILEAWRDQAKPRSVDRQLATLGLGLLPTEPLVVAVDQWFQDLPSQSRKRIQLDLHCLLLGMLRHRHDHRQAVLNELLEDAVYRDHPTLGLAARNLGRISQVDPYPLVERHLDTRNPHLLRQVLVALDSAGMRWDLPRRQRIAQIARRHAQPQVRIAALHLLCAQRQPEALELARSWFARKDLEYASAGLRCLLRLGGRKARRGIEAQIIASPSHRRRSTLLEAMRGPYGEDFLQHCAQWALDAALPHSLRRAAALCLAEAGWKDVAPLLVTYFLDAEEMGPRLRLARALTQLKVPIASKILRRGDLKVTQALPLRLRALCLAGHPEAEGLVADLIRDKDTAKDLLRSALRSYRAMRLPRFAAEDLAPLPKTIRALLAQH